MPRGRKKGKKWLNSQTGKHEEPVRSVIGRLHDPRLRQWLQKASSALTCATRVATVAFERWLVAADLSTQAEHFCVDNDEGAFSLQTFYEAALSRAMRRNTGPRTAKAALLGFKVVDDFLAAYPNFLREDFPEMPAQVTSLHATQLKATALNMLRTRGQGTGSDLVKGLRMMAESEVLQALAGAMESPQLIDLSTRDLQLVRESLHDAVFEVFKALVKWEQVPTDDEIDGVFAEAMGKLNSSTKAEERAKEQQQRRDAQAEAAARRRDEPQAAEPPYKRAKNAPGGNAHRKARAKAYQAKAEAKANAEAEAEAARRADKEAQSAAAAAAQTRADRFLEAQHVGVDGEGDGEGVPMDVEAEGPEGEEETKAEGRDAPIWRRLWRRDAPGRSLVELVRGTAAQLGSWGETVAEFAYGNADNIEGREHLFQRAVAGAVAGALSIATEVFKVHDSVSINSLLYNDALAMQLVALRAEINKAADELMDPFEKLRALKVYHKAAQELTNQRSLALRMRDSRKARDAVSKAADSLEAARRRVLSLHDDHAEVLDGGEQAVAALKGLALVGMRKGFSLRLLCPGSSGTAIPVPVDVRAGCDIARILEQDAAVRDTMPPKGHAASTNPKHKRVWASLFRRDLPRLVGKNKSAYFARSDGYSISVLIEPKNMPKEELVDEREAAQAPEDAMAKEGTVKPGKAATGLKELLEEFQQLVREGILSPSQIRAIDPGSRDMATIVTSFAEETLAGLITNFAPCSIDAQRGNRGHHGLQRARERRAGTAFKLRARRLEAQRAAEWQVRQDLKQREVKVPRGAAVDTVLQLARELAGTVSVESWRKVIALERAVAEVEKGEAAIAQAKQHKESAAWSITMAEVVTEQGRKAAERERERRERQVRVGTSTLYEVKRAMPTRRVTTVEAYDVYVQALIKMLPELHTFEMRAATRRARLQRYRNRMAGLDKLCKMITGGDPNCVVIFGHALPVRGFGYTSSPLRALRQRLHHHARAVFVINEAYTSKRCSVCAWQRDAAACYNGDLKPGHSKQAVLTAKGSEHQHRIYFSKRGVMRRSGEVHGVRFCTSCETTWHRDINAARNILLLLCALLRDGERPAAFRYPGAEWKVPTWTADWWRAVPQPV